jgi:hypothetical protein
VSVVAGAGRSLFVAASLASAPQESILAKLDVASGARDPAFAPPALVGGQAAALFVAGDALFAAGSFDMGSTARRVAKLDRATGRLDATFAADFSYADGEHVFRRATASAVVVAGPSVYVGGNFSDYRGAADATFNLAKLDAVSGALDPSFSLSIARGFTPVSSIAVADDALFAGGASVAKLDFAGTLDPSFGEAAPPGFVSVVVPHGSSVYFGGNFATFTAPLFSMFGRIHRATGALR